MSKIEFIRNTKLNSFLGGLAIAGAFVFIIGLITPDNYKFSKTWLTLGAYVSLSIIFSLSLYLYLAPRDLSIAGPKVIKFISSGYLEQGGFLVRQSPLLSQNLNYTVVLEEDEGFERILGVAKYLMSQNNGLVQLMVVARLPEANSVWSRLDEGETSSLRDIRIRMGVPSNV